MRNIVYEWIESGREWDELRAAMWRAVVAKANADKAEREERRRQDDAAEETDDA